MLYLDRPIFLFAPNWAGAVRRRVTFELRPEDIGFNATYFNATADWTVNQWSFDVLLNGASLVKEFNDFFAALTGRLDGFWLPVPVAAGRITAGTSTTVFSIEDMDLSDSWNDRPDVYLLFTFADGTQAAAQIEGVVSAGATETVTLSTDIPQTPDANTRIQRLHYVRLAADREDGDFLADGVMQRRVDAVEIPTEYAAAALGLQPIYLFKFWSDAPALGEWRFTSFAGDVVSGNQLFTAFPINFSNLSETADGSAPALQIEARPDAANPLMLFLPVPFSGVLNVQIMAVTFADLETQTKLFTGRVVSVQDDSTKLSAKCESRLGLLKNKVPRWLKGKNCNNTLYEPNTCRALRAIFETTINVVAISDAEMYPPTVTCTFLLAAFAEKFQAENYLAGGLFEAGQVEHYEARTIIASSWDAGSGQLTMTLNLPLHLTQAGDNAQVVAGCDHTDTMCKARFDNYQNFSGFVAIPNRNPTLKAVNANPVSQGGK